ncbi:MAG: MoaD/ThiS family protein [Acidimicrobiia bacterium]|nr:MoaD/ThiS family protein [Acidimicrobiia bacterium]NNF65543.1 MoaD/ThiS family protein [Acidimicrobiia bacterium]
MAKLRLFANLREAAGVGSTEVDGNNVSEVLEAAAAQFGDRFAAGLPSAQVWVNGDMAELTTAVTASDEVAVIPPVSGGAEAMATSTPSWYGEAIIGALLVALFAANLSSLRVFVFVLVAIGLAWVWDLVEAGQARNVPINIFPPLIAVAAAANGAYVWGWAGFAIALAIALMMTFVWAIIGQSGRGVDSIAITALTALIAGLGAGGLALIRLESTTATTAFLAMGTAVAAAVWITLRLGEAIPVDPNLAALAVAVVVGIVAALTTDTLGFPLTLLGAAAVTAGLLAGSAFGGLVRAGSVLHTEQAPGLLSSFDGVYLAAGLFWVVFLLFG